MRKSSFFIYFHFAHFLLSNSAAQFDMPFYASSEKIFYQFTQYNLMFVSQHRIGEQRPSFLSSSSDLLLG